MILSCRYATPGDDLSGHTLDLDRLKDAEDLQLFKVSDDYIIAAVCPREKKRRSIRSSKRISKPCLESSSRTKQAAVIFFTA